MHSGLDNAMIYLARFLHHFMPLAEICASVTPLLPSSLGAKYGMINSVDSKNLWVALKV